MGREGGQYGVQWPLRELCRSVVRSGWRATGISRRLIEFGLAYGLGAAGQALFIGSCISEHLEMYRRGYGFDPLLTERMRYEKLDLEAHVLAYRSDMPLPEPTRTNVEQLRKAMHAGEEDYSQAAGPSLLVRYHLPSPTPTPTQGEVPRCP